MDLEPYDPAKHGRPARAPRNRALAELLNAVTSQGPMLASFESPEEAKRYKHMIYTVARNRGLDITAWVISPTQFAVGIRGRDRFTKS